MECVDAVDAGKVRMLKCEKRPLKTKELGGTKARDESSNLEVGGHNMDSVKFWKAPFGGLSRTVF